MYCPLSNVALIGFTPSVVFSIASISESTSPTDKQYELGKPVIFQGRPAEFAVKTHEYEMATDRRVVREV